MNPDPKQLEDLISLSEAADLLGMSIVGVLYHVYQADNLDIVARLGKRGDKYLSREAVERFKAERESK